MTPAEQKIKELTSELVRARALETECKNTRIELEEKLLELIDVKDKGSVTIDAGNGLKVSVTTGYTYKADVAEIAKVMPELVKEGKPTLDEKAYEELREKNPQEFVRVSRFVTVTPKKPTVSLKVG